MDRVDFRFVKTAPFHPFDIEAMQSGAVAGGIAKWRHIFGNHRARAENRPAADANKLMDSDQTADNDIILNRHMAAEGGAIGDDITIADNAIMRDMAIHHEQVMIAHPGNHAAADRAGIERRELANLVVVADNQFARFASVL